MKSIRTASFKGTSNNQKGNEEILLNEEMAGTIITVSKLGIIGKGRKKYMFQIRLLPLWSQIQQMTMEMDAISLLLDQLETSVFNNNDYADQKMLNKELRGNLLETQIKDETLRQQYSQEETWEETSQ